MQYIDTGKCPQICKLPETEVYILNYWLLQEQVPEVSQIWVNLAAVADERPDLPDHWSQSTKRYKIWSEINQKIRRSA